MINDLVDDYPNFSYQYGGLDNGNSSGEEDNMDRLLSNENLSSFIMDSPFSFRNPIFFSVPRDPISKKVEPLASKRHLFGEDEPAKDIKKKVQTQEFKNDNPLITK